MRRRTRGVAITVQRREGLRRIAAEAVMLAAFSYAILLAPASVEASTGPAVASRAHRPPPSRCAPARSRRLKGAHGCSHADGAPRHRGPGFKSKPGNIGGAGVPDQYLPWLTGEAVRVSQGNQSPCGWSHAPPRCNSIGAYTQFGWDFLLAYGEAVHAAVGGRVVVARGGCNGSHSWGCNGGYGNTVVIQTPTGDCSRYEHLSALSVGPGQPVAGYEVIGAAGSSGNSTGTHLHYQREVCPGRNGGIALASSFIEAGVPHTGQIVVSRNHAGAAMPPLGPQQFHTLAALDVYGGPGTTYPVLGRLASNATITVVCQAKGSTAVGGSFVWDSIGAGQFVSDYYVDTPVVGDFSPGLPACAPQTQPTPSPPPTPSPTPTPIGTPLPTGYWIDVDESGSTTSGNLGGSGSLAATGQGNVNYGYSQECAPSQDGGPFSVGHYPPWNCSQVGRAYNSAGSPEQPSGFWFTGNQNCVNAGRPFSGAIFTWHVQLPAAGHWHVDVYVPTWTSYGFGDQYILTSADGQFQNSGLTQQAYHGQWVALFGSYRFAAGQDYTVELTLADGADSSCHYQMADQMRWVYDGA